jgi:hypothetical protein
VRGGVKRDIAGAFNDAIPDLTDDPDTARSARCWRRDLSSESSMILLSRMERSCARGYEAPPGEEVIRPLPSNPGHPRSVVLDGRAMSLRNFRRRQATDPPD